MAQESPFTKEWSTPKKWGCTEWLYTIKEHVSHMIGMSLLQWSQEAILAQQVGGQQVSGHNVSGHR